MNALASLFTKESQDKFTRVAPAVLTSVPVVRTIKKRDRDTEGDDDQKKKPPRKISRKDQRAAIAAKKEAESANKVKEEGECQEGPDATSTDVETGVTVDDVNKRTIFVGNVPLNQTVKSLTKFFTSEFGEVVSLRLRSVPVAGVKVEEKGDMDTVRKVCTNSRKFGEQKGSFNAYVEFRDPSCVAKACADGNNMLMGSRHIRVDTVPPTLFDPKRSVFMGGLPSFVDEEDLRTHFANILPNGQEDIASVRLIRDPETLMGKGIGYMLFTSRESVIHALSLHESTYKKRVIRVTSCAKRTKQTEAAARRAAAAAAAVGATSAAPENTSDNSSAADAADAAVARAASLGSGPKTANSKVAEFNANSALKRIRAKNTTGIHKTAVADSHRKIPGQKDKDHKGRYGKRLGGVVKRAMKASKKPDAKPTGHRKQK